MLDFSKEKYNCVGCTACYASCPVQAISMQKDEEGFTYPVLTGECINCGKCKKVCPIVNRQEFLDENVIKHTVRTAYAAVSKNRDVWIRSSSGGAYTEVCRAWDDGDTYFAGALWEGFHVCHQIIHGFENIKPFCKSKYVESDLNESLTTIKTLLGKGKRVVFCGTPCQVAGLKSYLGKDYDSLLTIDLICHGVGSPSVFSKCMPILGEHLDGEVQSYEFRAKRKVFEVNQMQKIRLSKGREIYVTNDPYIQLFLKQTCLRPSCGGHCKFRNENRQGDITLADFKALSQVFPKLGVDKRNYSTIILNTKKGKSILEMLEKSMNLYECSVDEIKRYNPLFYRSTKPSEERDKFFAEFVDNPEEAIRSRTGLTMIYKISMKRKIWALFPVQLRYPLVKILNRIGGGYTKILVSPDYSGCSVSKVTLKQGF